jgi:hypothetical protein
LQALLLSLMKGRPWIVAGLVAIADEGKAMDLVLSHGREGGRLLAAVPPKNS